MESVSRIGDPTFCDVSSELGVGCVGLSCPSGRAGLACTCQWLGACDRHCGRWGVGGCGRRDLHRTDNI